MIDQRKIRLVLGTTESWDRLRRAARALTNDELAQAEHLERLGRRRRNTLSALKAERQRRNRGPEKMLRLRVESKV